MQRKDSLLSTRDTQPTLEVPCSFYGQSPSGFFPQAPVSHCWRFPSGLGNAREPTYQRGMLVDKKPSFLDVPFIRNCPQQRLGCEHTFPWSSSLPFVLSSTSSYCRTHILNKSLASKSLSQVVHGGRGDGSWNKASSLITGVST